MGATIVRREPVGVVGGITPWNYPQVLAMMKIAPALAAGCTVVLKPSPETALDSYVFGDAAVDAGLPEACSTSCSRAVDLRQLEPDHRLTGTSARSSG